MRSGRAERLIELFAFGEVPQSALQRLLPATERRFEGRTAKVNPRRIRVVETAFSRRRNQYRAEPILRQLLAVDSASERCLGVVDLDLFSGNLNFIFGLAQPGGSGALVALPRLRGEFWGEPADERLFWERVVKEVVHELGHTYGLEHCPNRSCVMWFSNTLPETDAKGDLFCGRHEAQLSRALRSLD